MKVKSLYVATPTGKAGHLLREAQSMTGRHCKTPSNHPPSPLILTIFGRANDHIQQLRKPVSPNF
ncbi:MAG: hypothetical protein J0I01_14325 [Stenotrophomonas nitritireducens]|uniref:hypothetical protein n=1 Tax=Stenotrophomonas nitritireducens TaxID=83617 RepID=UPI001AD4EBFB|nr:hypothetical protein [Stenotrophomonas nitritireducens]MBN8793398.1 hypothetical protein [Stenotrophomonas nitritireducens]